MGDLDIRQDVLDGLEFEPSLDAAHIGVSVENGIVLLTGHVRTYDERLKAEQVVTSIKGVRGIAQDIEVRPVGANVTADDEIARRVLDVLKWNASVPTDAVKVKVAKGWVTLSGAVEWNFQREAAEHSIRGIAGVVGISNAIVIATKLSPADLRLRIERALKRRAELEMSDIRVEVSGGTVTLDGKVHSIGERRAAEQAVWAAPGVVDVRDRLSVV
ncbi:BON domain-containing protein [Cereibacter sediminicola]|uniref:BON domain-containing protein n=1 Tax=Cereibacter sediminicola TaxID=2584941 RepID=UPI0011A33EBF|nr:BON domain-containing protein [Cereibacter sediminicola]